MKTKLNLGCGSKHLEDAINLDLTPRTNPDVIHDLNQYPWPFEDNRFEEIHAYDCIEHLDNLILTMEEIFRVSSSNARTIVTVPHFSSSNAFTDPTHLHFFSKFSLDYFTTDGQFNFYSNARFEVLKSKIIFRPSMSNKLVHRLANRFPRRYEERWCWVFPAWYLYFELRTIK